jgi:predicted metal-binding membrane protein
MDMPGMDMSGMPGMDMAMAPVPRPWAGAELLFTFSMWAIMMTGMMLPAAAPMLLLYARMGRQAAAHEPFAATGWFASGYLLAWTGFSLLAALAQSGLSSLALLDPMLASASLWLGGAFLIAAGAYQWTGFKNACLAQCRSPLVFIQQHGGFKRDAMGSLRLGVRHGLYCVGCCWALMLLLFVGGVMNLFWVAALAILVLLEKAWRRGLLLSRLAGLVMAAAGLMLLLRGLAATA